MLKSARSEVRSKFQVPSCSRCTVERLSLACKVARCSYEFAARQVSASERDPGRIQQLLAEGREAADFIRTFVVQAKLNERGNYGEVPLL